MKKLTALIILLLSLFSCYGLTSISKGVDFEFLGMEKQGNDAVFEFSCTNSTDSRLVLMISAGSFYAEQDMGVLFLIPESSFLRSRWSSPNSIKFAEQLKIESHKTERFCVRTPIEIHLWESGAQLPKDKIAVDMDKLQVLNVTFLFLKEELKLPIRISNYESLVRREGIIFTKSFVVKK